MAGASLYRQFCLAVCLAATVLVATPHAATLSRPSLPRDDGPTLPAGLVWSGFDHKWLRKVVGFETPHRMGAWADFLEDVSYSATDDTVNATYASMVHPGVDGDFQHPTAFFSAVRGDSDSLALSYGTWEFSFQDNSTGMGGKAPHADTLMQRSFAVDLSSLPANFTSHHAVLGGFELDMKCVPTSGYPCNSNGIWAYRFNLTLNACTEQSTLAAALRCQVDLDIGRGWTPTHGGGKPYNPVMAYTATVHYVVISAPQGGLAAALDHVSAASTIHAGVLHGRRTVASKATTAVASDAAPAPIVGLRAFGFELTHSELNRGRYLEELTFAVRLPANATGGAGAGAAITYDWQAGFTAPPTTTANSNVRYSLSTSTIALAGATADGAAVLPGRSASGTICEDDPSSGFKCAKHHLPASLNDTVPVSVHMG